MGSAAQNVRVVGRYALYGAIAAGGMATVHLGRLLGPVGFSRTVAIKRLHAQFAADPEFVSMFLDEARLAARIRHPNVVPTLDVVATGGELFLVMEYVPGESLARLSRALRDRQQTLPLRVLSGIITGVLHGLHSAHEAKDERGHPLGIVHRDVSPQNVLAGTDGVARVLDFGVAKAAGRMQTTKEGQIKGKLSYMPPEQLRGAAVNRQTDIYACGVMLWELVTGQRLFAGDNEGAIVAKILDGGVVPPSRVLGASASKKTLTDQTFRQTEALDATILRALHMQQDMRFTTAREMALEIERSCPPATASEIGDWVEGIAKDVLNSRAAMIAEIESSASFAPGAIRENNVMSMLSEKHPLDSQQQTMTRTLDSGSTGRSQRYVAPVEGPPVTQPSSISVSTATPRENAGGKRAVVVLGIALGLVVVSGSVAFKLTRPHAGSGAGAAPSSEVAIGTASVGAPANAPSARGDQDVGGTDAEATTSATTATASTIPSGATTPLPAPTTTTTATAGMPTPAPGPKKPSPVHTAATARPAPAPPAEDCNPPFWFDAAGVKHYKPSCLTQK